MANSREPGTLSAGRGFRSDSLVPSLSEVHRSLLVPPTAGFLRKLLAFAGPGFLVAVGYMD
ncbi:MAG: divalent metal cation transporter, partial [Verrucomicrobiota bacterium]|nr:divalent metal cation transporter [Verrucomicrobiota bacterium]